MRRLLLLAAIPIFSPFASFALDGALDASFGDGGVQGWPEVFAESEVVAAALRPDGGVIVAGTYRQTFPSEGTGTIYWRALDSDGAFDPDSWCTTSAGSLFSFAAEARALSALVDSSGRLLIGGWAAFQGSETVSRALVARFDLSTPGCTLDGSFSANGWMIFDDEEFCDTEECEIVDLAEIQPQTGALDSPRLVLLLRARVNSLVSRQILVGLATSGQLDAGFGSGGHAELDPAGLGTLAAQAQLESDATGALWLLASRYDPGETLDLDPVLARFTPDGELDTAFSNDGWHVLDDSSSTDNRGVALAVGGDGGPIASWTRLDTNQGTECSIDRIDGDLLGCTSLNGTDFPAVAADGSDRKLHLRQGASAGADLFQITRRTHEDGALDSTFGSGGTRALDFNLDGGSVEDPRGLLLSAGRPLVVGDSATGDGGTWHFVARLTGDRIFADGFEVGTPGNWSGAPGL